MAGNHALGSDGLPGSPGLRLKELVVLTDRGPELELGLESLFGFGGSGTRT